MQQQVGLRRFPERGLEGGDQRVRQTRMKTDGVGQHVAGLRPPEKAGGRVVSSVAKNWSAA